MKNLNTLEAFVIVDKTTEESLFGDRLFDTITAAKTAFYQRFNRGAIMYRGHPCYRKRFDQQTMYKIVWVTYNLVGADDIT